MQHHVNRLGASLLASTLLVLPLTAAAQVAIPDASNLPKKPPQVVPAPAPTPAPTPRIVIEPPLEKPTPRVLNKFRADDPIPAPVPKPPTDQVPDRTDREQSITRGQNNGHNGYWVNIQERTYRWFAFDAEAVRNVFRDIFGDNLVPAQDGLDALAKKIADGQLSLDQLKAQLRDLKPYLDNVSTTGIFPNYNVPNGPYYDYHYRAFNLPEMESRYGKILPGQFNDSDWEGRRSKVLAEQSAPNNNNFYHNTKSILSQAYRFTKIAEAMESGILPPFTLQSPLTGNFSQYAGSKSYNVYDASNPYMQKFASKTGYQVWAGYSDLFKLSVGGLNVAEAQGLAKALYREAVWTASPVAFDLNNDGKIGVTGLSTAMLRNPKNHYVPDGSLLFDLSAEGKDLRCEWLNGSGDGFLVDDRQGKVTQAARGNGRIDGSLLFGNAGGYANGFAKLAAIWDTPALLADKSGLMPKMGDGTIKGGQLNGLKVWKDANHDGRVQTPEVFTLASLGITEVSLRHKYVLNNDGEYLMRSQAIRNGKPILSEDVWFALDPAQAPAKK